MYINKKALPESSARRSGRGGRSRTVRGFVFSFGLRPGGCVGRVVRCFRFLEAGFDRLRQFFELRRIGGGVVPLFHPQGFQCELVGHHAEQLFVARFRVVVPILFEPDIDLSGGFPDRFLVVAADAEGVGGACHEQVYLYLIVHTSSSPSLFIQQGDAFVDFTH